MRSGLSTTSTANITYRDLPALPPLPPVTILSLCVSPPSLGIGGKAYQDPDNYVAAAALVLEVGRACTLTRHAH